MTNTTTETNIHAAFIFGFNCDKEAPPRNFSEEEIFGFNKGKEYAEVYKDSAKALHRFIECE
jgi:hypothetical protein